MTRRSASAEPSRPAEEDGRLRGRPSRRAVRVRGRRSPEIPLGEWNPNGYVSSASGLMSSPTLFLR